VIDAENLWIVDLKTEHPKRAIGEMFSATLTKYKFENFLKVGC